jgi:hypothetical protein
VVALTSVGMHMREKEQQSQSAPGVDPVGEAPTVVRPVSDPGLIPTQVPANSQDDNLAAFPPLREAQAIQARDQWQQRNNPRKAAEASRWLKTHGGS